MTIMQYVQQGGVIMYILVLLNIIGFTLLLWKTFSVVQFRKNPSLLIDSIKGKLSDYKNSNDTVLTTLIKDETQLTVHNLETGLNTIKVIATIAPLLGLLGTVIGILSAFQVISAQGMSDPSLFASGIAMALVTTVGGLIVAIPHLIGYNYLVAALDDLEIKIEKHLNYEYMKA